MWRTVGAGGQVRCSRLAATYDFQGKHHFLNIMRICAATKGVLFWIPTREAALVRENVDAIPGNVVVRVSGNVVDGSAPAWWPTTSTVVTDPE
jgi:hypothetical protein